MTGRITIADGILLDPIRLAETRALIQASSGGGKSYLLRRIVEGAAGRMPVIVIDPEGEFHTVREIASMVLVGPNGEIPCDVKSAGKVARGLLEHAISAIVDLSELPTKHHDDYVAGFLRAIMHAPRSCWRPSLICIDEAHRYCSERAGETRAAAEVIDLMSRGRKRGFGGILLTQRISKLRKDAAAEAGNVFLGRTTLDIDVKRSAENLGMTPRDAQVLRTLAPGEWFAYGPALNVDGVGRFRAIEPRTKEPEKGQNATPPVRDPEAVAQLAAMVAESAADDRPTTLEDAEAQIRALRAEVDRAGREAETRSTGPTPEQAAEIARRVVDRRDRQWSAVIEASTVGRLTDEAENAVQGALAALAAVGDASRSIDPGPFPFDGEYLDGVQTGRKPTNRTARGIAEIDGRRVSVEQRGETWTRSEPPRASGSARDRLLAALAWWAAVGVTEPTEVQAAFVAGISPRSSTTRGAKAALRDAGLIDYRPTKRLALTEAGLEAAPDPGTPTLAEWHARIAQQLGGGAAGRAFVALLDAASSFAFDAMSVDELCAAIDVSPASSTTRGALAALRKLGLIEKGTPIRPTDIVYPKGLR